MKIPNSGVQTSPGLLDIWMCIKGGVAESHPMLDLCISFI